MKKMYISVLTCVLTCVVLAASLISGPVLAMSTTEVNILRHPGNGSSRPLLEAVVEVFPEEARKRGIENLKINFMDFQVGADAIPLFLSGKLHIFPSGSNNLAVLVSKVGGDVQLLTGWGGFDYKLICSDPTIKTVKDIRPDTRIAAKAINNAEHYFIKSLAKKELGSFNALDKNMIVLPRPQIQQLMEAGDNSVTCAVPGTPIQDSLVRKGKAHVVYQSDTVNTVGVSVMSMAMKAWTDKNPKLAEAWVASVKRGSENFNRDPRKYLSLWKITDNVRDDVDTLLQNMQDGNVQQTYKPISVVPYVNLMIDLGIVQAPRQSLESLAWQPDLLK